MKFYNKSIYKDGGTELYITNEGFGYCVDNRIGTKFAGRIFAGYPLPDNSNILDSGSELEQSVIAAIINFRSSERYEIPVEKDYTELIKKHLGIMTPDWIIENVKNLIAEVLETNEK